MAPELKSFIDDNGLFEIDIPISFKYQLLDSNIHTFQNHSQWNSDTFQISINKIESTDIEKTFYKRVSNFETFKIHNSIYFLYPIFKDKKFTTIAWTIILDGSIILFTFTYNTQTEIINQNLSIEEKLDLLKSCSHRFQLIKPQDKDQKLNFYRFDMFLQGIAATSYILEQAVKNKAFIEATCILATQIDALLRTGIVLENQILNNNKEIAVEWIYQGQSDKKKTEKDIYKKSKELNIISEDIYNRLFTLYNDRNRIIHRFIISEITLAEVEIIAFKYYRLLTEITEIIYQLETKQIKTGIGMTIKGSNINESDHLNFMLGKIGNIDYIQQKQQDKIN